MVEGLQMVEADEANIAPWGGGDIGVVKTEEAVDTKYTHLFKGDTELLLHSSGCHLAVCQMAKCLSLSPLRRCW